MGKSLKKLRNKSMMDLYDMEDSASTASTGTFCSAPGTSTVFEIETDMFQQHIDELFEKRASTREKALSSLISFLREDVRIEECSKNEATMLGRCIYGIKRGGASESVLASTLLGLHVLTLGEMSERLLDEVEEDLYKASVEGKSTQAKVSAVETLAVACFVMSGDDGSTSSIMERLRILWVKGEPKVQASALRSWSFLLASLKRKMPSDAASARLWQLAEVLNAASDVEVRTAAGEAATLLYKMSGLTSVPEDLMEEESAANGEPADDTLSGDEALEDVVDRMADLANNRGDDMRRSRKSRASLRSSFRGFLSVMQGDSTVPAVKVKLQFGDMLVVDSLEGVTMLNFLRKYLGAGFQAHLQRNTVMHSVFGFSPREERAERMTAMEKRQFRSPCSAEAKHRTKSRASDRSRKADALGW